MKAKEYLQQIRNLDRKINIRLRDMERWRMMAFVLPKNVQEPKYDPNRPTSASFEKCIAEADALDREICERIDKLVDMKEEAMKKILLIGNSDLEMILEMRYLRFMSWEEMGDLMNYSKSWVLKKHAEALERMESFME